MIGVLIVAHADFGQGIINAVELIAGSPENVKTIGLHIGDGIEAFEAKVTKSLKELDQGEGVIGLCDFLGGSPSNVMLRCMEKKRFPCIVGANMPMAIEAIINRNEGDVWELANKCRKAGMAGILSLESVVEEMEAEDAESDDF